MNFLCGSPPQTFSAHTAAKADADLLSLSPSETSGNGGVVTAKVEQ